MVRAFVVTLTTVLTLVFVAGCEFGLQRSEESAPTPSATSAAPQHLADPKVGECHDLTFKEIAKESDTAKPVACSEKHTTRTIAVVDAPASATRGSDDAQAYAVGKACGPALVKVLGSDAETRAKTLYSLAWFMPTKEQKAKGAKWMRCDVTLTDQEKAYALDEKPPFLADKPSKDELVCGRIDPDDEDSFQLVPCSVKHQFKPNKYIAIGEDVAFKDAEAGAKKACETHGPLYTWSHAEKWGTGERFFICWDILGGNMPRIDNDEIVV